MSSDPTYRSNVTNVAGDGRQDERTEQMQRLGPWFHNLHLPDGSQTAPQHFLGDFPLSKWQQIAPHLPQDLTGWTVLDIGCNAGFYSIELARRGARVLGIDHDPRYLEQARWAVAQFQVPPGRIKLRQLQVYELARLRRTFDLVLFMGVFYHLRYPTLALDIVAEKVGKLMLFQTLTMPGPSDGELVVREDRAIDDRQAMLDPAWPKMAFIEHRLNNDPTNWWAANATAVEALLRSTGLRVRERPGSEMWLCEPAGPSAAQQRWWDQAELRSATGALCRRSQRAR